jgi:hypothetical protein
LQKPIHSLSLCPRCSSLFVLLVVAAGSKSQLVQRVPGSSTRADVNLSWGEDASPETMCGSKTICVSSPSNRDICTACEWPSTCHLLWGGGLCHQDRTLDDNNLHRNIACSSVPSLPAFWHQQSGSSAFAVLSSSSTRPRSMGRAVSRNHPSE